MPPTYRTKLTFERRSRHLSIADDNPDNRIKIVIAGVRFINGNVSFEDGGAIENSEELELSVCTLKGPMAGPLQIKKVARQSSTDAYSKQTPLLSLAEPSTARMPRSISRVATFTGIAPMQVEPFTSLRKRRSLDAYSSVITPLAVGAV